MNIASRIRAVLAAVVLMAVCLPACQSKECAKLRECCQSIRGVEGVGGACGPMAKKVDEADKCTSILDSITYMFEDKDRELPEACELEGGA